MTWGDLKKYVKDHPIPDDTMIILSVDPENVEGDEPRCDGGNELDGMQIGYVTGKTMETVTEDADPENDHFALILFPAR